MGNDAVFAIVVTWYASLFVLSYEVFIRRADRSRVAVGRTSLTVPNLQVREVVLEDEKREEVLVG